MKRALMGELLKGRAPFGLPGGSLDMAELEEIFKSNCRPKTAHEIELAAAMTGKESEIKYLNECISGLCEKVAELTKTLDKKTTVNEGLNSELAELRTRVNVQANELERKNKHIANIAAGKEGYSNKLIAISKVIDNIGSINAKIAKADLLKVVEGIRAVL